MTKENCEGCEDNFYNIMAGVKECWNFGTAILIWRKKIPISQRPPWKQKAERYPTCYKAKRFVFVEGNREY